MTTSLSYAYALLCFISVSTILITLVRIDKLRKIFGAIWLILFGIYTGIIIGLIFQPWAILVGLIAFYQIINIARLVENRMHYYYLRKQITRTSLILTGLLLALPFLVTLVQEVLSTKDILLVSAFVVSLTSFGTIITTWANIKKSRTIQDKHYYSDVELPTVSILIPARNEDSDLTDCIHSALASDYPKLEVIVLDDCSQDKSSDIVKSFAHKGVRFIQGDIPKDGWLAKNQAYDTLAAAASGHWLLFSGVDVRFGLTTVRTMITHALNRNRSMLSILPKRDSATFTASLLFPLRYWYELAIPRDIVGHPSVLSTCWLIKRSSFKKLGGFSAVSRAVIPESYLARELNKTDKYQFIRANNDMAVLTRKSLRQQYSTAIRTRYPQVHRRLEMLLIVTVLMFGLWIWPTLGLVISLIVGSYLSSMVFLVSMLGLLISHLAVTTVSNPSSWAVALINFPLLVLQDIILFHVSMYKYEFSEVIWKGRNVCYPIMHIEPTLPRIK